MHLSGIEYVETDSEGTVKQSLLWSTEETEYWLGELELVLRNGD